MSIHFRNMTEEEFSGYMKNSQIRDENDLIQAGLANEENASEKSAGDLNFHIPEGFKTPKAYFYVIINSENEDVGVIWLKEIQAGVLFIIDFIINEQFRRHGYGRQTIEELDSIAFKNDCRVIILSVFEKNSSAKRLYESCGFTVYHVDGEAITMIKKLEIK